MCRDLGFHRYKVQLTQEMKPDYHRQGRTFTEWALEQLDDPGFNQKIIANDKARFWLNGFFNKHNCRI